VGVYEFALDPDQFSQDTEYGTISRVEKVDRRSLTVGSSLPAVSQLDRILWGMLRWFLGVSRPIVLSNLN